MISIYRLILNTINKMKTHIILSTLLLNCSLLLAQDPILVAPPDIVLSCSYNFDISKLEDYSNPEFGNIVLDQNNRQKIITNDIVCHKLCQENMISGYPGYIKTNQIPPSSPNLACEFYQQLFDTTQPSQKYELLWGISGYALGSSQLTISIQIIDLRKCGVGKINRIFKATDGTKSSTAIQSIWIVNCYPFDINKNNPKDPKDAIKWPDSLVTINGCGADLSPDNPQLGKCTIENNAENNCSLLSIEKFDEISTSEPLVCFKITRKWVVIDWCQYDPFVSQNFGKWEFIQTIYIIDNEPPSIAINVPQCIEVTIGNSAFVDFKLSGKDNCTPEDWIFYEYLIDINNDNMGPINGYDCSVGRLSKRQVQAKDTPNISINPYAINRKDPTNPHGNYPIGKHRIILRVEDGCGNKFTKSQLFAISESQKPILTCLASPVTKSLTNLGKLQIYIDDLVISKSDNCSNNLTLSFDENLYIPFATFNCSDFEKEGFPTSISRTLDIWVKDEAGNTTSCQTIVEIQDNQRICNSETKSVSGNIYTLSNKPLEQVDYKITSNNKLLNQGNTQCTNQFEYLIKKNETPYGLNLFKKEAAKFGIDVWDIALITRHILLGSPFTCLESFAADVNNSNSITASDISEINKLILNESTNYTKRKYDEWNFFDDHCSVEIKNAQIDSSLINIIGFRFGDINGDSFSQCSDTTRPILPKININYSNHSISQSNLYNVAFKSPNFTNMCCLQLDLKFDPNQIIINQIIPIKNIAFHYAVYSDHITMIISQQHPLNPITFSGNDSLFFIVFEALVNSNSIDFNASNLFTEGIAYDYLGKPYDILINNRMTQSSNEIKNINFVCYPNPVDRDIILQWNESVDNSIVELINADGKVYFKNKFISNLTIQDHLFPIAGIYFIKLTKNNIIVTKKIIKI